MHHGGRDGVVKPGGCCHGARCCCSIDERSDACVPLRSVFDQWAAVNRCRSVVERAAAGASCFEGTGCAANTSFCLHHKLPHAVKFRGPASAAEVLGFFAGV